MNAPANPMSTEHDPALQRLFAEAHQRLPSADFLARHVLALEREKRFGRLRHLLGLVLGVGIAAFLAPWLIAATNTGLQWVTAWVDLALSGLSQLGASSLAGWVVCGLTLAIAPLLFVWRLLRA